MFSKKIGLIAFVLFASFTAISQEQLEFLEFPKEKKLFSIEARIGYYWDLQSVPDSIPYPLNDFYKKMGEGPRADFSILYNWGGFIDIGFGYSYLKAISSTKESLTLTYLYFNGSQSTLIGKLSGEVTQQYFSLRVDPHFEVGKSFSLNPGVSTGILNYQNITRIDDLYQKISGQTLAFEMRLGLEYYLDQNLSLNLTGSYMLSYLYEPELYNTLEEISTENQSMGLSKWYLGVGLRYNFTKKGSAMAVPASKEVPPQPKKKSRFD